MRILHVNNYDYLRGGSDSYFLSISSELSKIESISAAIYAPNRKPNRTSNNLCNSYLKNTNANSLSLIFDLRMAFDFYRAIKEFKPDIVHLHIYYGQLTSSILIPLIFHRRIKILQTTHEYKIVCPIQTSLKQGKICKRCKNGSYSGVLITNCNTKGKIHSLALFIEAYIDFFFRSFLGKRFYVSPVSNFQESLLKKRGIDGILQKANHLFSDIDCMNTLNIRETNSHSINIIYFGRIEKLKGLDLFVNLALNCPNIRSIHIYGEGSYKETLRTKINDNGLTRIVQLHPLLNKVDLVKKIDTADVFINPSNYLETFGLNIIEAMSRGKIVVSSKNGAPNELISNNKNGFLYETDNQAIELIKNLENYDLVKIREEAVKTANNLSKEKHLARLLNLYRKILK